MLGDHDVQIPDCVWTLPSETTSSSTFSCKFTSPARISIRRDLCYGSAGDGAAVVTFVAAGSTYTTSWPDDPRQVGIYYVDVSTGNSSVPFTQFIVPTVFIHVLRHMSKSENVITCTVNGIYSHGSFWIRNEFMIILGYNFTSPGRYLRDRGIKSIMRYSKDGKRMVFITRVFERPDEKWYTCHVRPYSCEQPGSSKRFVLSQRDENFIRIHTYSGYTIWKICCSSYYPVTLSWYYSSDCHTSTLIDKFNSTKSLFYMSDTKIRGFNVDREPEAVRRWGRSLPNMIFQRVGFISAMDDDNEQTEFCLKAPKDKNLPSGLYQCIADNDTLTLAEASESLLGEISISTSDLGPSGVTITCIFKFRYECNFDIERVDDGKIMFMTHMRIAKSFVTSEDTNVTFTSTLGEFVEVSKRFRYDAVRKTSFRCRAYDNCVMAVSDPVTVKYEYPVHDVVPVGVIDSNDVFKFDNRATTMDKTHLSDQNSQIDTDTHYDVAISNITSNYTIDVSDMHPLVTVQRMILTLCIPMSCMLFICSVLIYNL